MFLLGKKNKRYRELAPADRNLFFYLDSALATSAQTAGVPSSGKYPPAPPINFSVKGKDFANKFAAAP